jgi:hypothetical protein
MAVIVRICEEFGDLRNWQFAIYQYGSEFGKDRSYWKEGNTRKMDEDRLKTLSRVPPDRLLIIGSVLPGLSKGACPPMATVVWDLDCHRLDFYFWMPSGLY